MRFDPSQLQTLVVKIGTNLLRGKLAFTGEVMELVVKDLCALKKEHDINIVLVSSGAVGCGMNTLGIAERPTVLSIKQAVAAVGQATLVHYYETLFRHYGEHLSAAQILLTRQDLDNRESYLNIRNTFNALFDLKCVVPVVNENDTTAVEQLRFGDNDTLAARVSAKINAGLLIILSDVDGLYDKNPAEHPDAKLLEVVEALTPEIRACAAGPGTATSVGGMHTKLDGAAIATSAGVPVVIANGHRPNVIREVLDGTAPCTTFLPSGEALSHRKRWIAHGRAVKGRITIDSGALSAVVDKGRSLLPAGIVAVQGEFDPGAAVEIADESGRVIARALVNYSSAEVRAIIGRKSNEIAGVLGHKGVDEVVHRDNLVLV
ncbi:MAG: glutamate 5-kinase [Candidatus Hydrogenedens sp.]|nr:glutamate 5-kinase [Candidatus Hydrogenedens sp.]